MPFKVSAPNFSAFSFIIGTISIFSSEFAKFTRTIMRRIETKNY